MERVDILGTEWSVELLTDAQWLKHKSLTEDRRNDSNINGVCFGYERKILVRSDLEINHRKSVLRHEIIHAFQYESGVFYAMSFNWDVENETEWLGRMIPKITKAWNQVIR